MNRRLFMKSGILLSATLIPGVGISGEKTDEKIKRTSIKPKRLMAGDKIGLIAPGFHIDEKQLEKSIDNIKNLGFEPYYTDLIKGNYGYFSNTDKNRAEDINLMFKNPEIKGIICAGGGYGCTRILDLIDYDLIRKNPKVIMGFSDATALINAINQQTGLITFHGPVAQTIHRPYNSMQFKNVIVNPSNEYIINSSFQDLEKKVENPEYDRYMINSGSAVGTLTGGNLSLLSAMSGTAFQVKMENRIVFIEDIDEKPYRIDRMLTQLIECGELTKASGIIFGILRGCNKSDQKPGIAFSLKEVIMDRIKPLKIPAVYGLSFGHNINNFTLPIGAKAILDANNMTLKLQEKAVV